MKLLKTISKLLQIGLLLTFLLPFFPAGCKSGSSASTDSTTVETAAPAVDTAQTISLTEDSIAGKVEDETAVQDTLPVKDSLTIDTASVAVKDSSKQHTDIKDISLSEKLTGKLSFLKPILRPHNKYTGLGYMIEMSLIFFLCYGIINAFMLWIIALVLKIRRKRLTNTLNIIGFLFLCCTYPVFFTWTEETRLWGYWVCFWWAAVMIILDIYILIKTKKHESISPKKPNEVHEAENDEV